MSQTDLVRFRRMCGQFRWLAVFMVVSVGGLLALLHLVFPALVAMRDGVWPDGVLDGLLYRAPTVFYLFAVWSIGRALGQVAKGRLIQPALSGALRRVGLSLGLGGVISVFVVTNLSRLIGATQGGYLHFDVAGMTLGMIGGALFLLGRVMDQAGRVQAELDEMI
ncbi:DUF2975 domain-containing protein [Brevundimonas sp.]|uniref:DUF2975 domain-containing protein n=1 Tax=Brevundimonas sp. TaxID=1871086 RepID=UPI002FC64691